MPGRIFFTRASGEQDWQVEAGICIFQRWIENNKKIFVVTIPTLADFQLIGRARSSSKQNALRWCVREVPQAHDRPA